MLQLDPTTQASLEAATTPNARAAAILSSLTGTITVTVRDGAGTTKGSGTMTSFGIQSANVIVLNNVTSFTVSETGTPDPATWTIEFATAGGRFVKGTFGLYTSPVAEFKWSLATWENGQSGTIASAYCTVRKNEVLTDAVDTFNIAAAPTNQAPYWLPSRPTSFNTAAGTVLQLAQYATDPDGNVLTYSITSFIPPGYAINSTTGALTIGTGSASITISVSDGLATADWSVPVTVTTSEEWNPSYPRTAACLIGSFNWNATVAQLASRFQLTIVAHYPNASYGSYANVNAVGTAIKAYNPSVKLLPYTNPGESDDSWTPFYSKLISERGGGGNGDWYLRNATGARVQTYPPYYRTNLTRFVTPDSNGETWATWQAKWFNTEFGSGPWDGVFLDVVYTDGQESSVVADWDENGSNDDDTTDYIESALAQGWADAVGTWRTLHPDWIIAGEFLGVSRYAVHPLINGLFNGAQQDFAIGNSWSVEEWGGWALMMQWYRTALGATRSPYVGMLAIHDDYPVTNWPRYVVGGVTESNDQVTYRVIRYGLCSTLLDNGWFTFSTNEFWASTIWADEYDWNLGQPMQTPRTSAYSLGVYLREFDNGCVIVNPKGNGSRTITLPSAGTGKRWDRLTGTQAPAINTGATNVTSITINERDGLILKRVNA